jgi:electron transfer flavoprotein beta subunit
MDGSGMDRAGINSAGTSGAGVNGAAIGVALKPAPGRVGVDPLTGVAEPDRVPAGASAAGLAALEIALRMRDAWQTQVVAVTAGPADAEPMLRDALALGADHAIRIEVPLGHTAGWGHGTGVPGTPSALATAAGLLANALAGCAVVLCGDGSHGSGTGAVPALIAAHGGRAQALGLTRAEPGPRPGTVYAERRLDGGWRERLLARAPMVLSVEGGAAQPRRAGLDAVLASRNADITVLAGAPAGAPGEEEGAMIVMPYRPRARILPAPGGETPLDRVMSLLGTGTHHGQTERVDADPPAAAKRIADQLRHWGYL